MRVILKPAGFAVVVVTIGVLAALVVVLSGKLNGPGTGKPSVAGDSASSGAVSTGDSGGTESGKLIIDPTEAPWTLATQPPAQATKSEFNDATLPGNIKHAVRLEVTQVDPAKFWCAQLIKKVPQSIKANHNLTVRFWARSAQETSVHVVFEDGQSPHTPELDKIIRFTPDWKEYTLRFRTTRDHDMVPANFCLKAGMMTGEVEISDVRVSDGGPAG
ncbi:MAG: hypothetical protein OHK0029_08760 [Armatimonadaceae bacterium]